MCSIPNVLLNNGRSVPIVGLGTWRSPPEVVTQAIKDAIDVGYRHFDCAYIYGNEAEIGCAIAAKLQEGVVKREDLFITSKLWNTFHHPSMVRAACETSLKNLGLTYLDSYLMHWPTAFQDGHPSYPKDEDGQVIFSNVDILDTWRAMEQLVDAGLCYAIGISNFNERQLERLLEVARIRPAILQIECHPYLIQNKMMEFCRERQIAVTAYSALGSAHTPYEKPGSYTLLQHPQIKEIADKHEKSPAQVLLRYQTQRGNIVIPRSVNKDHMTSNLHIFGFELSSDDICTLDGLDCNGRFLTFAVSIGHPEYPFDVNETKEC